MSEWRTQPHKRWNPLTRSWVLVSPHRTQRPWQGQQEEAVDPPPIAYDPECYLCPRNKRANGETNPDYKTTFWFTNDFAALKPELNLWSVNDGLLRAEPEAGLCRVLCYSPNHSLTMGRMTVDQILPVIAMWKEQFAELSGVPWLRNIQIFENRGQMMGASNPHPHGQLWANQSIPDEVRKEAESQSEHFQSSGRSLLEDYLAREENAKERIVTANQHFVALVPFWAVWPFEILLISRRPYGAIIDQTPEEDAALAAILREIAIRYDNLFRTPFPYSLGLHQAPVNAGVHPGWHFHIHYYPPLLRSATVRKFLVGYEMLAWPQRDITAESAAERLRSLSTTPYWQG